MIRVSVQDHDFKLSDEIARISSCSNDAGAVVSFVGLVRGQSNGEELRALILEHYPEMTEREILKTVDSCLNRWPLKGVTVIHRFGQLKPNDQIVLVLTAAPHRQDAFDAAQYLMDYLKTRAPFWKREIRASGEHWVEAREADDRAAARWDQN